MAPTKMIQQSIVLTAILMVAFSFQNCAKTSFSELPPEPETALRTQGTTSVGGSCGQYAEGETWEEIAGTIDQPKPGCASGVDTYENIAQYRCEGGQAVGVGTRTGEAISSGVGQCPVTPTPTPKVPQVPIPPVVNNNCGSYANGQTKTLVEGTFNENLSCAEGQTGTRLKVYQRLNTYLCSNGTFIRTNSMKGNLISDSMDCKESRPIHCTDVATQDMCEIYKYLFGRWPEQAGAVFWTQRFTSLGVPKACWYREVSKGTTGSMDCNAHYTLHGTFPHSGHCPTSPRGDALKATATAECP